MPKQQKSAGRDSAAEDARDRADDAEELIRRLKPVEPPTRPANADDPGMETT